MERESLDAGRRSSIRQLSESSGPYYNMSVNPWGRYDVDVNTSIYDSEGRIAAVSCEFYKSERPNPPLSNKILTQYYCVQRSVLASKAS